MAAGKKIKMRMFSIADPVVKYDEELMNFIMKHNIVDSMKLFEIKYEATLSVTESEISAPNAEFNGTSSSIPLGIVSTDAKDTVAGVGVRKVKLLNVNADDEYEEKELTLAGTTTVIYDEYPKRLMHMFSSLWGSELDAAGAITLFRRAHDILTDISAADESADSGLTAATGYYWKVNIDGGGITEFTITTGTDTTWSAVLTLMNAEMTGAVATIIDGNLRITSDSGTSIATTAGTTGTDLLVTAGGTTASNQAKEVYLTIGAATNESDGGAIYIPTATSIFKPICFVGEVTSTPQANRIGIIKMDLTGFDSNEDPDFDYSKFIITSLALSRIYLFDCTYVASEDAKITLYELYETGEVDGFIKISYLVFDTSGAARKLDVGAN